jgi:hypothetical protein
VYENLRNIKLKGVPKVQNYRVLGCHEVIFLSGVGIVQNMKLVRSKKNYLDAKNYLDGMPIYEKRESNSNGPTTTNYL